MEKNHNSVFGPDGEFYGLDGADFEFSSKSELWRAVSTPGHPLSNHAEWIRNRLQHLSVKFPKVIRVDCDFNPPVVETVYPRLLAQTVGVATVVTFWALAIKILLVLG